LNKSRGPFCWKSPLKAAAIGIVSAAAAAAVAVAAAVVVAVALVIALHFEVLKEIDSTIC
jgi:hypothetical protein